MVDRDRFGGVERLFGAGALERLAAARVTVVGLGGVGSWAVEALARSGVGNLVLVDLDDICVTNTNRQIHAVDGAYGKPKWEALAERVRAIAPGCNVEGRPMFVTATTADAALEGGCDYAVDAIDRRSHKCALIAAATQNGIPIVTVGGAGGRRDPTRIRSTDLAFTERDELLRQVRRKLRADYGFPRAPGRPFGVQAVFSPEPPSYPWSDGRVCAEPEPGSPLALDCASGFGTAAFVTGAFGLAAAGVAVNALAGP
jgi:tRNA A37 threonylcarbamoyladenosine dehydratase